MGEKLLSVQGWILLSGFTVCSGRSEEYRGVCSKEQRVCSP